MYILNSWDEERVKIITERSGRITIPTNSPFLVIRANDKVHTERKMRDSQGIHPLE